MRWRGVHDPQEDFVKSIVLDQGLVIGHLSDSEQNHIREVIMQEEVGEGVEEAPFELLEFVLIEAEDDVIFGLRLDIQEEVLYVKDLLEIRMVCESGKKYRPLESVTKPFFRDNRDIKRRIEPDDGEERIAILMLDMREKTASVIGKDTQKLRRRIFSFCRMEIEKQGAISLVPLQGLTESNETAVIRNVKEV